MWYNVACGICKLKDNGKTVYIDQMYSTQK